MVFCQSISKSQTRFDLWCCLFLFFFVLTRIEMLMLLPLSAQAHVAVAGRVPRKMLTKCKCVKLKLFSMAKCQEWSSSDTTQFTWNIDFQSTLQFLSLCCLFSFFFCLFSFVAFNPCCLFASYGNACESCASVHRCVRFYLFCFRLSLLRRSLL